MVINKLNFPVYGLFLVVSLICGLIFNYFYLKKCKIQKRIIFHYLILFIPFALVFGFTLSSFISKDGGLSSYAGAIGVIVGAIVYEKICPSNKIFIKCSIMSLPLIYSVAKIGCFLAGCCYGLPYNKIFSVTYPQGLNIPLVPIQLIETIVFLILFFIILLIEKKHNKNIISITIVLCSIVKFLLDFLRYDHLNTTITLNQIISIVFVIIAILLNKKTHI